jgi:hypothetical protein
MPGKRHIVVPNMWTGKPPPAFADRLGAVASRFTLGTTGVLLSAALAAPAHAVTPGGAAEDMGARALGRGGVGRADGADVGGEELNLAASALTPQYILFAGGEIGPDGRLLARTGAVDSRTSVVALGAGYRYFVDDVPPTGAELPGWKPAGTELANGGSHQRVHLGLAVPLLERRLSFGGNARFDWGATELAGDQSAFNFGFSVAARPVASLTFAAGARNLLVTGYPHVQREVDLSARFDPGKYLGIEADVVAPIVGGFDVGGFQWRAGADVAATTWLTLRGGWSMDAGAHSAHAGLALVSDKATLDYGVKVRLDDPSRNWHAVDLRVNF